jgi:hypothetical protein
MRALPLLLLFATLAAAQSPEAVVLGGPCLPEKESTEFFKLLARQNKVAKSSDREAELALIRQIVRSRCSNEYWWFHLAEKLVELGRPADSIAVLDVLYQRHNNSIDAQLHTSGSLLRGLFDSALFQASPLAARLVADRQGLAQRRRQALARLSSAPAPPANYVAKPACPFECCGFGAWSVNAATRLFDCPGRAQEVGRAAKGAKVEALTGEVHLKPEPILVRFAGPVATEGSIVYLLDNIGEGFAHVWIAGKIEEVDVNGIHDQCAFASDTCWGEFIRPELRGTAVWWVRVKTRNGVTGWTRETSHFDGKDRCG